MKRLAIALLAVATAAAIMPSALADTVTPLTNSPTSLGENTVTAPIGGTLVGTISGSVTAPSGFTATYTEWAYTGATDNPFGSSDLTFALSFENTGSDVIGEISTGNMGLAHVDEGNLSGSGGSGIYANLGDDLNGAVTLFLSGGLAHDMTADTLLLFTNGTVLEHGLINFQDNTNISAPGFALTPEPGSLLLLGTGLFGLAFLLFRKSVKPSDESSLTVV